MDVRNFAHFILGTVVKRSLPLVTLAIGASSSSAAPPDLMPGGDIELPLVPQPFVAQVSPETREFDALIFGKATDAAGARRQLHSQLAGLVREMDFACDLSLEQERKLELAGRGDVKRFFEEIDRLWQDAKAVVTPIAKNEHVVTEARRMQVRFRHGLFESDDSLLEKVAGVTLNPKQRTAYQELKADRRRLDYEAHVLAVIDRLQRNLELSEPQRRHLLDVMRQQTRPPQQWGTLTTAIVMRHMAMIPRSELLATLNEYQRTELEEVFKRVEDWDAELRRDGWRPAQTTVKSE